MFDADVQFANYITEWFENIFDDFFDYFIGKVILAVFIMVVYFGYLFMASRKKEYSRVKNSEVSKGISTNIIFTVLSLVTFVYAVFTISTLVTALTSNAYNLPDNMTYTEYARSGFFQLAWLSVINFLLLLGAQFMMRNKSEKAKTAAKVIFTIQVVINLCLLGLSAYKMSLYSGAYGLTLLRTLVYIILAYELVMLLMLMFKVYNEKFKFVLVATYFSFAFWGVVSFINIEAFAVGYNTKNLTVDEFDFSYTCYRTSRIRPLH